MSENDPKQNQLLTVLQKIFNSLNNKIIPIINTSEELSSIINYLNDDSQEINNKLQLIFYLILIFRENKLLIHYFISKCKSENINLLECIINIYLKENIDEQNKKIIWFLFNLILENSTVPKSIYEFIYQKMSYFYIDDNMSKLTEEFLLKIFKLLQVLYEDTSQVSENDDIIKGIKNEVVLVNNFKEKKKDINNYIYFNGKGSSLSLTLNRNSINVNSHFPTIENGCSILFWANIDKQLTEHYFNLNKNIAVNLITIILSGHQIRLIYENTNVVKIVVDEINSNQINISNKFIFNSWNIVCLNIEKINKVYKVKLCINGFDYTVSAITLPKDFPVNEPMNTIKLFENFFGRISTVLFFSFNLNTQIILNLKSNYNSGFYKNKYLFKFLNSNDDEYFSNSPDYNFCQKYKNNKSNSKLFKIKLKEQNIKNLISCFVPFTYDKEQNIIDDIFGNFIGLLGMDDGANNNLNYSNALNFLGGINNLLPFAEIMFLNRSILNQNTFYEYLLILDKIIIGHSKNLTEAIKTKFFSNLGLFLEKFPSNVYSNKILEILLKIGKDAFQLTDDKYYASLKDNFINMILLNEKIFSKFSQENQAKLWEGVYQFFNSNPSEMKETLNISKICLLLRFYDEKKYEEYCCRRHADLFNVQFDEKKNNNNTIKEDVELKVMKPEMNEKVGKLFDIIQLYIDKLNKDKDTVNLFKLLSLDLSPCLQKKIIEAYYNHFTNSNINKNEKKATLENLLKNNFLEITEYVLSISLLDIRIELLKLFKMILQIYSSSIKSHINTNNTNNNLINIITNNPNSNANNITTLNNMITNTPQNNSISLSTIYMFIGENLLPEELMVEIENNNNGATNQIRDSYPLVKYFNGKIYEEDKYNLWILLDSWFSSQESQGATAGSKSKPQTRLNNFALDFCIKFVSSDVQTIFVDNFISSLNKYTTDKMIQNKDAIYENKNIYPWILETIFYFYNKENEDAIEAKELIPNIQKNALKMFTHLFTNKKIKDDFTNKMNYIFDYSYYMKKLYANDKKKLYEISRITRLILEKLMENSEEYNKKSQICFDFMFLYKNSEDSLYKCDNDGFSNYGTNMDTHMGPIRTNNKMKDLDSDDDDDINEEEEDENINDFNSIEKFRKKLKKSSELMPIYIYDGIFFNENLFNGTKETKNKKKSKTLKEIWEDFILYDSIIDSYRSNFWGTESLCKKVKVEYDGNPLKLCKKLTKEFSESKKYKNILTVDIKKCLGIKKETNINMSNYNTINLNLNIMNQKNIFSTNNDDNDDSAKINILQINLILLCVAIDITQDNDEREFLEGLLQQFLIYCVLASINIGPSEKSNSTIQSKLYDILLFGLTFFQKKNKTKYDKLFDALIKPIFDELNNDHAKKGIKGLFTKKTSLKNSAIMKLFVSEEINKQKEKELKFDEVEQEDDLNNTMMVGFGYATDRRGIFKRGIANNEIGYKDDTTINKKKKKVKMVLKLENPKIISGKIFDLYISNYKTKRNREDINEIIKIYYRNIRPNTMDQNYAKERMRVNNIIKEMIPFFETDIKRYSNTSFLEEKKRRNEYKKCKKQLFSWRGFWSNRYLFFEHPELLKQRKKNHFTKEMIQPLLAPILDIDYYLPEFKKFDKSKLFNKNNYNYRINLDIDDILKEEIKEEAIDKINYKKNKFGFNYLKCLYKLPYSGLWDQYKYYHENDINFQSMSQRENNYSILSEARTLNSVSSINSNNSAQEKEKNKEKDKDKNKEKDKEKDKEKEKEAKNDKKNSAPIENTYHCCIVKLTHHIKGFISTGERHIKFNYSKNENILDEKDDPNYDKDMGSCFGSIFKNHRKDKDKIGFEIEYLNIKYMFNRHYFYNESGIEIYTETNKSYFLNFKNNKDLSSFIYDVMHHAIFREIKTEEFKGKKKVVGFENIPLTAKKKSYGIVHKVEDWQNYNISTLEYLMWLNIYAGRSFNDLTQYPVFPWIITNYKTDSLIPKNDYRNLSIPMGMMDINDKAILRKETFLETYDSIKNDLIEMNPDFNYQEFLKKGDEYFDNYKNKKIKKEKISNADDGEAQSSLQINQLPYYYGSHYSNPTYISNYLTRTFPFSLTAIEIQGEKFDDPDRMFLSIQKTFESASSLKDDVRELIPEFYILPEIFLNLNNLNLSQDKKDSEGNEIIINDVDLPPWSKKKTSNFVAEMRRNLENSELKINKWIDLIFGNLQRGTAAEEHHNLFMAHTYEKMVKIDTIEDSDSRNALMRLVEVGVTPFQIFENESKSKIDKNVFFSKNSIYSNSKDNFLEECKSMNAFCIKSNKYNSINNNIYQNKKLTSNKEITQDIIQKISKIIWLSQNNLRIFTNTNYWYNLKYNLMSEIKVEEESNPIEIENNSNKYAASYFMSSIQAPMIIYANNKYMMKGGFWDGRIEINSLITGPKEEPYSTCIFQNAGPITVMAMSKNEHFLLCGTKLGVILAFQVYDKNIELKKRIFSHSEEVTSISINETLNMFATASKDGYIMIHIMPTLELVRSIKVKLTNKKQNQNVNNIYANNVFLSNTPIPVVTIFISQLKIFKSYSINGLEINEQEEEDYTKNINCFCIYNNVDFQDFLIYGTDDGLVKIRKFPEMDCINSINPFDGEPIETLTVSQDKRYCYVWGKDNQIGLIKDNNLMNDEGSSENFARLGYIKK